MANKLYLIRHGRTLYNKQGRLRAHEDVPLDSTGKADAERAGKKLKGIDPEIGCVYCSDLQRSHDTANRLAKHLGADVEVRGELRPWHLGTLTGQKVSAILPLLDYYQKHTSKKVSRGEAYNDFFTRWVSYLKRQIAETRGKKEPDAIVTHARHMLSLDAALKAMDGGAVDTSKIPSHGGIKPTGIVVLHLGKNIRVEKLYGGQDETATIS